MRWLATMLAGLALVQPVVAAEEPGAASAAEEAFERLRKADCRGMLEPLNRGLQASDAKAFFVLGAMYLKGTCVDKDVPRGLQQLELSAKAGESLAAEQLVLIHGLGRDVPQDYGRAGVWAVALWDISKLAVDAMTKSSFPLFGMQQVSGAALDPTWTKAFGQAATVQALATERILNAGATSRSQLRVDIDAVVTSAGPDSLPTVAFEEVILNKERFSSNGTRPAGREIGRDIHEIFEGALREVPPLESPVSVQARRGFMVIIK